MKNENDRLFQIGDVARMFHISVGSLRHYEKIGLLQPEYINTFTGYRYYTIRQFECLNTIRYLRALDMPLEQIADFLKNRDLDGIQDMLRAQKEAVVKKQEELKIIEKKIDNRLKQIQDALCSKLDTINIITIAPRRLAWIRNSLSPKSYLDLETSIRKLEQHQKDSIAFLGKVGVGISKERLLAGKYDQYDMVFIILDREDVYTGTVENIPEETCVTIRFCGSHKDAGKYYVKLCDFIAEKHMRIANFSKEITMIDYGMTNDTDKFVTEIQIPVQAM